MALSKLPTCRQRTPRTHIVLHTTPSHRNAPLLCLLKHFLMLCCSLIALILHFFLYHIALILHSYCTSFCIILLSYCTSFCIILHSYCTSFCIILLSYCSHIARLSVSYCSNIALILHFFLYHIALILHSYCTSFCIILYDCCRGAAWSPSSSQVRRPMPLRHSMANLCGRAHAHPLSLSVSVT
jgi:hypothetical protein